MENIEDIIINQDFDVCVIGAGPGGYVAAIRSAQLGLKTIIIEKEALGGTCLNVGCIPSKALITAAHFRNRLIKSAPVMGFTIPSFEVNFEKLQVWKTSVCHRMAGGVERLLNSNNVSVLMGEARFISSQEIIVKSNRGDQKIKSKNFVIATGSRPIEIPGFKFDEQDILSSTGALALEHIPKRLTVIGGGYIGLEIGTYFRQFGSEVTMVESTGELFGGLVDKDVAKVIEKSLKNDGVKIMFNAQANSYEKTSDGLKIQLNKLNTVNTVNKEEFVQADKILVTVGRRANGDQQDINFKQIGLEISEKGFIVTNEQRRTNISNIFAIGDVAGTPLLAHKASYEGILVAEVIAGQNRAYDVKTVPAIVFTNPEVAYVGLTEAEAISQGHEKIKIGKFPFAANGRAVSLQETDGFVKIIADSKTDVVLGVHIVGPEASNLISEAALALEMGATLEDIALTIHPHPTLSETFMESAEAALGHAIHIVSRQIFKN